MIDNEKKITLGETRAIQKELEAFAGRGRPRGCPICRNGDQNIAKVAKDAGYTAAKVAEFLIKTRDNYDEATVKEDAVYRHWHRCGK